MSKKNDPFLRHEALHMSSFLMMTVENELVEHDYIKSDEECSELAKQAFKSLFDLYQLIGTKK